MKLIHKNGDVEIWEVSEGDATEFMVYGVTIGGDPICCPSIGMAREVAARAGA